MKDYRVEKIVKITSGRIRLDDDQARRRPAMIKEARPKGTYEILKPVQFKVGEVIGLPKIDKSLLSMLTEIKAKEK